MINLYDIKKKVKQRHKRNPNEFSEIYCQWIDYVIDCPTIESAYGFMESEERYLSLCERNQIRYGLQVLGAIEKSQFFIEPPHVKVPGRSTYDPSHGYVYLAISEQRPEEIKIGSTTQDPIKRVAQTKQRYGYSDYQCVYWIKVDCPARIERKLHEYFSLRLVNGMVFKDSKEWFFVTTHEAIDKLYEIVISSGYNIYEAI